MNIEEQGEIEIKNLTIHNAPLVMYREFQNGMVFLNASKGDYTLDADEHPDLLRGKYEVLSGAESGTLNTGEQLEIKALDALFLTNKS